MSGKSENRLALPVLLGWAWRLRLAWFIFFVLFSFRQTPVTALLFLAILGAFALTIHVVLKLVFWGIRRFLERRIAQRKPSEVD